MQSENTMHALPTTPTGFWDWVATLQTNERLFGLFMLLCAAVVIVLTVAIAIHHIHQNRLAHSLKREMLERGMSADEIATVMNNPAKQKSR